MKGILSIQYSYSVFSIDIHIQHILSMRRYVDPVMATGWHMLLGGLPLLALSVAREGEELGPRLQQLTGEYSRLPIWSVNHCHEFLDLTQALAAPEYHPTLAEMQTTCADICDAAICVAPVPQHRFALCHSCSKKTCQGCCLASHQSLILPQHVRRLWHRLAQFCNVNQSSTPVSNCSLSFDSHKQLQRAVLCLCVHDQMHYCDLLATL